MKPVLAVITGIFILVQSHLVFGATVAYVVSATVPQSTQVSIDSFSIDSTGAKTATTSPVLSFNPLNYVPSAGMYTAAKSYAIDVNLGQGSGSVDTTVTYSEGANPNAPGHGLGWKATATFNKVTSSTDTGISTHPKKLLKDVVNERINASDLGGGVLRVYVGMVTKDPNLVPPDPANGEVISNSDKAGSYDGTITISTTVN